MCRLFAAGVPVRAHSKGIERRGHAARAGGTPVTGGYGVDRVCRTAVPAPIAQDKGSQFHPAPRLG